MRKGGGESIETKSTCAHTAQLNCVEKKVIPLLKPLFMFDVIKIHLFFGGFLSHFSTHPSFLDGTHDTLDFIFKTTFLLTLVLCEFYFLVLVCNLYINVKLTFFIHLLNI